MTSQKAKRREKRAERRGQRREREREREREERGRREERGERETYVAQDHVSISLGSGFRFSFRVQGMKRSFCIPGFNEGLNSALVGLRFRVYF